MIDTPKRLFVILSSIYKPKGKSLFRFATSPTGDMHIDNLRVALFSYICATQADDKLLIRIEDTDQKQNIPGKDQEILEILSLFGITYSDVTYQSHNLKFHQQLATKLLMDKNAFSCFCTPEMIDADRANAEANNTTYQYNGICENLSDDQVLNNESPFSVRVKRPNTDIEFTDKIKGKMHFSKNVIDSYIILRVDKSPTYNFACAIDDLLGDISMVIRAEDDISNTPKQIMIRDYLGYDKEVLYAHLPTILNDAGKKMNKDDEAFSVTWLLEEGFLPSAIANYLIMIGNKTATKIFDISEALEWFDLASVSKAPAKFDIAKLRQINREHINRLAPLELAKFIGYSSKDLGELAKIYTEEGSTINEIKPKIDAIFSKKEPSEFQEEFATLSKVAKEAPYFKEFDDFEAHLENVSGLKEEQLFKPLRFLLTKAENGPDLSKVYPHIRNYLGEIIK